MLTEQEVTELDAELNGHRATDLMPLQVALKEFVDSPNNETKDKLETALVAAATHPLMDVAEHVAKYYEDNGSIWGGWESFPMRLAYLARQGRLHLIVADGEKTMQEHEETHRQECRENGAEPNRHFCERCGN